MPDGLRVEPSFEQIEERREMAFAGGLVPCRGVRHRVAVRGAFVDLRPVRHPRLVEGRFERCDLLCAVARVLVGVAEVQLSFQPGSGTMRALRLSSYKAAAVEPGDGGDAT